MEENHDHKTNSTERSEVRKGGGGDTGRGSEGVLRTKRRIHVPMGWLWALCGGRPGNLHV